MERVSFASAAKRSATEGRAVVSNWENPKGRKQELIVKCDTEKDSGKVWDKIKTFCSGGEGFKNIRKLKGGGGSY